MTFNALLVVAQTPGNVGGGSLAGKASPAQMFDAPPRDSHDPHREAVEQESKARIADKQTDERYDRASVDARRSEQLNAKSFSDTHPAAGRSGSATGSALESRTVQSETRPSGSGQSEQRPSGSGAIHDKAADRTLPHGRVSDHGRSFVDPATTQPLSASSGTQPLSGTSAVGAVNDSGGSSRSGPAHQIARYLGLNRSGGDSAPLQGVESTRAVRSSSMVAEAAPSTGGSKENARAPGGRALQGDPSSRPVPGSQGDSSPVEQSAFDELVRSIRLHRGSQAGVKESVRLRLDPPELGAMRVDVRIAGERVEIDVRTETTAARRLVRERAGRLSAALARHGIAVERFDVSTQSLLQDESLVPPDEGGEAAPAQGTDQATQTASGDTAPLQGDTAPLQGVDRHPSTEPATERSGGEGRRDREQKKGHAVSTAAASRLDIRI